MVAESPKEDVLERLRPHTRQLTGLWSATLTSVAVAMAVFQLYTAAFGLLLANIQRAIHLAFTLVLVFLMYPPRKSGKTQCYVPWYDLCLCCLGVITTMYLVINFNKLAERAGLVTPTDLVMGLILMILVAEAARRAAGWVLSAISVFVLSYSFWGAWIPGYFQHRGFSLTSVTRQMYLTTEGIFGVPLGVSTNFIFLFILFGVMLGVTGAGQVFIDLAIAIFGRAVGGPAKAAVIGSALFGTINGSSVANVVGTGSFTIPLMKKIGYPPEFAGAVEASASTGGQIMPPIMGSAAFIIAEFLGVPYLTVALAAAIPAVMYFTGVLSTVHFEAVRLGLRGLNREELPKVSTVLLQRGYLLLPIVLIVIMLMRGYTPTMTAFWAIVLSFILSLFRKETRCGPRRLLYALAEGSKSAIEIAVACAVVGFIVGTATLTGLGMKLAGGIVLLGQGRLFLTLVLTMIASLVLGMGVPTTANYVIMAMMTIPALITMGVHKLAAHLFCFYFGIISDLTPPVALAAVAGSGVAGAPFLPTAFNGVKLGLAAYLAPYFFVYSPSMLLGTEPFSLSVLRVTAGCILGMVAISASTVGHIGRPLKIHERLLFIIGSLCLIDPKLRTDAIGIVVLLAGYASYVLRQHTARRSIAGMTAEREDRSLDQ